MALTSQSDCKNIEKEREMAEIGSRSSQSNDSGNELSVGGSSSEGGDSMLNHQNHNDNEDLFPNDQNQHNHTDGYDDLNGFGTCSNGNDGSNEMDYSLSPAPIQSSTTVPISSSSSPSFESKNVFNTLVGSHHNQPTTTTSTLFDTPASILQSPQNLDVFSPNFAFANQFHQQQQQSPLNQMFQCANCGNFAQMGLLQFICAHKTCQTCCQTTPISSDVKKCCGICGAGPATAANFPPQMFLSPTHSTPQHGGMLLDHRTTPNSARSFTFSLNGMSLSPNIHQTPENSFSNLVAQPENDYLNMNNLKNMDSLSSPAMWTSLVPPPLALKNISNLNPKFDTLSVFHKDDHPVFSPLSPTNTSILPPIPLAASDETTPSKMSWAVAPPRPSLSSSSAATTIFQEGSMKNIPSTPMSAPLLGLDLGTNNMNPFNSTICQGCDGNQSNAFCLQCQETLCSHCVQAHQRVRATKSHRVVGLRDIFAHLVQQQQSPIAKAMSENMICDKRINGSIGSICEGHPSFGESDSLSGDSSPISSSVCRFHESRLIAVCDKCAQPMCSICVSLHSNQHKIHSIGDIRYGIKEMSNESYRLGWQCDQTVESIKRVIDSVTTNAMTAEKEIRTTMDTHIKILEERKADLLSRLDTAKNMKLAVLTEQAEKLKTKKIDLSGAIVNAKTIVESSTLKNEEEELNKTFEQLSKMIRTVETNETPENRYRAMNVRMLACQVNEDDKLKFVQSQEGILLNKCRQFGNVESGSCAQTSNIIGESYKKGIRDRQSVIYVQLRDASNEILPSSVAAIQQNSQPLLPHQSKSENNTTTQEVQAVMIGPDGSTIDTNITSRENGIISISYMPFVEGFYHLTVLVKGTPINGCPATIEIRRGRNYEDIAANGPILTFGKEGSGDGELCRPWGICVDSRGRVLVADRSNNRVQIFDKDGNFLSKFGTSGNRPGQFDRPAGITTNTKNNIIVADKDNHRIQVFDENGNFVLKFGDRGRAIGYFNYPWGVATNSHNAIAVSDTRNHRVQIFTEQGQFVRKCGFDSAYFFKNLDSPRGLCYLPDGQLLITDFNNHRLAILSPRNMSEMKVYGCEGDVDGMFVRPQGVKIDSEGHILVCDSRNNRIQVFDSNDMRFIASFGLNPQTAQGFQMPTELAIPYSSLSGPFGAPAFSTTPTPLNQSPRQLLDRPTDLAVGPDGRIYVVDFGNNCIRVF